MNWLAGNWHELAAEPWVSPLLALIAAFCGFIVGAERERKEKATGIRTLTLVSLGSSVFTMISMEISKTGTGDHAHIAAQVVTGIGFLGAGAIIHGRSGAVTGLTSAATIWIVAATGMLVGVGFAGAGVALALLILSILTVVSAWENKYFGRCTFSTVWLTYDPAGGKTAIRIDEILDEYFIHPDGRTYPEPVESGAVRMSVRYCHSHRHHREFLSRLAEMPEIREMHRSDPRCERKAATLAMRNEAGYSSLP